MFDLDKWEEIFESIRRHKLRTMLTAFGVFWGIFMLVLLLGAGNGLFNSIKHSFSDMATNMISISTGRTSKPHDGMKPGRSIRFDMTDYEYLRDHFENVDQITGRFFMSGDKQVKYKQKVLSNSIECIHPSFKLMENMTVTSGRYLTDKDLDNFEKVCIIGDIVKKDIFGDEDPIGKELEIDKVMYKVVGTFWDIDDWIMKRIYIPITTAQKVYSGSNRIHRINLTTKDMTPEEIEQFEEELRVVFAHRKNFATDDRRAIWTWNNADDFQQFSSMMNAINGIVWLVGIFSIIAGVIGVSNIMLIIVKDRTKEIGIRKSLGATPRSIIAMILQESIFITASAGYIGMACGVGVIALVDDVKEEFFRMPHVELGVIVIATLILVISGAIAGLIPALKAARINPVLAMKAD